MTDPGRGTVARDPSNIRVTRVRLPAFGDLGIVAVMKLKSNKANWATVFCAAAVFSLIGLRDAQAGRSSEAILPPPPISSTTDGTAPVPVRNPMPPPQIDNDLTSGEQLNGDFSGVIMFD
jgi:hypothetical protein